MLRLGIAGIGFHQAPFRVTRKRRRHNHIVATGFTRRHAARFQPGWIGNRRFIHYTHPHGAPLQQAAVRERTALQRTTWPAQRLAPATTRPGCTRPTPAETGPWPILPTVTALMRNSATILDPYT
ncbi:hypothetical protein Xcc1_01390 [Xanthomonas campestris pv. campestris]|nr:hypothetical protein Xcc1_01390 [Xanthomonas campestris pv. campestris]